MPILNLDRRMRRTLRRTTVRGKQTFNDIEHNPQRLSHHSHSEKKIINIVLLTYFVSDISAKCPENETNILVKHSARTSISMCR